VKAARAAPVAIAGADKVLMMEHSYYSVITPEGCARYCGGVVRMRRSSQCAEADPRRISRNWCVIDEIVPEPFGGAHRRKAEAINSAGDALERALDHLRGMDGHQLKAMRREKFLAMGREPGITNRP